ncbi:MAG: hypothetical protein AB4050_01235 [Synechococcus sp.]
MSVTTPGYTMKPHRRQYVVGPEPFNAYPDWNCHQLDEKMWLSHCPSLRVQLTTDSDGTSWALLGLAVETTATQPSPAEQIQQTSSDRISDLYSSWAGRWVLLGSEQVHMDASGLLGCLFGRTNSADFWASSSPTLLNHLLFGDGPPLPDRRELHYQVGISWFTPPRTKLPGITRLLPSQVLNLRQQEVVARPLMPDIERDWSEDDAIAEISTRLVTTVKRLASFHQPLWLGLTAGYDSRLMLALCAHASVDVLPFTRISARTAVADRLLPPQLARDCGYTHTIMRHREFSSERAALVIKHSAGHVSPGDADPFINGIRDEMEGISFGGHGFAVASGFSNLRLLPSSVTGAEVGAEQLARLFQEPLSSSAVIGLQEWLEWVLKHPQEHLDWRDRFFIEQRQAGWLAAKEQLYDLGRLERFPILNSALNYSLLLSFPEAARLGSRIQEKIIHRIAPTLSQYPFNQKDSDIGLVKLLIATSGDAPYYLFRKLKYRLMKAVGA